MKRSSGGGRAVAAAACAMDGERAGNTMPLRHVRDSVPGIRRLPAAGGFRYVDAQRRAIRDRDTLQRIAQLAIPPAWRQVWICPLPNGHLQATGRDARGRKQYRYHPEWVRRRSEDKFRHVVTLGAALPRLRRRIRADLRLPGMPREKVLALAVAVMGRTLLRVGNDHYARTNRSFGLTTLRNRHVDAGPGGALILRFQGKSGQPQRHRLEDRRLVRLLRRCRDIPGQLLFQYLDEAGTAHPIDSGDINQYLRQATGEDVTAKDFRTWAATLAALMALARVELPANASERALAALEAQEVAKVAAWLGNTPAVCRRAYIDPRVFRAWREGRLATLRGLRGVRQWELAALDVLGSGNRPR